MIESAYLSPGCLEGRISEQKTKDLVFLGIFAIEGFERAETQCLCGTEEEWNEHRISSTTGVKKIKRRTILKSVKVSEIRAIFLSTSDEIPLRGALRDSRSVSCSTSCYSDERDPVGKRGFIYKQE